MKAAYKHQVYLGVIGDMKTLETHFTRMALQGWMIDKIGLFTHRYRAIEPCNKQFFVDLLPQITAFDYPENQDAQDYRRLCQASGWTFVAANKQFHVFCAQDDAPPPVPIHTDNRIQAKIYLRASLKYEGLMFLFSFLMLGYLIYSQLFTRGIEMFLSNLVIFQMLGFLLFFLGFFWILGFVLSWCLRVRKSAKLNLPLPAVSYRLSRARSAVFGLGALSCLLCMLAGVVLEVMGGMRPTLLISFAVPLLAVGSGLWIRRQIDTRRRERKANIGLFVLVVVVVELAALGGAGLVVWRTMAVSPAPQTLDGRAAITLADIGIPSPALTTDTHIQGSVAVPAHYSHWESNRQGNAHTQVYRSISKTLARELYSRYMKELIREYYQEIGPYAGLSSISLDEAAFWGADAGVAVVRPDGRALDLVLLRGHTVLRLSLYAQDLSMETAGQAVWKFWEAAD